MKTFGTFTVAVAFSYLFCNLANAEPVRQTFGDWIVTCIPPAKGHKSCMMTQTLASEKLGKTISVFTIGRDRTGKLKASIRVPVGVALTAGLKVDIGHKSPFAVPYSACHRIGCFAPFDLTEPMVSQIGKATRISAVAQSVSQKALNLNFSPRGFSAAYAAYAKESR